MFLGLSRLWAVQGPSERRQVGGSYGMIMADASLSKHMGAANSVPVARLSSAGRGPHSLRDGVEPWCPAMFAHGPCLRWWR